MEIFIFQKSTNWDRGTQVLNKSTVNLKGKVFLQCITINAFSKYLLIRIVYLAPSLVSNCWYMGMSIKKYERHWPESTEIWAAADTRPEQENFSETYLDISKTKNAVMLTLESSADRADVFITRHSIFVVDIFLTHTSFESPNVKLLSDNF